jgi:hypothetical protein
MKGSWIAVVAAVLVACGSSDGGTDAPVGGVYYGSCDHRPPASSACVDFYCDSASTCTDPAVNGQTTCETGGTYGTPATWTTTACPTSGLVGTCTVLTSGDGRLVNSYYAQSASATKSVCETAGGIWTPGS